MRPLELIAVVALTACVFLAGYVSAALRIPLL